MTAATLVWRNLWRSRTRTTLTIASLAASMFLFTLLLATVESMHDVARQSAARLRLVVHHKTTMTSMLPLGYGRRLSELPGVRAVCGFRWFGGRVANSQEQFPSMGVDVAAFPIVFDDFELSANELDKWANDRLAAVVGVGLARRMGWRFGDRVVLTSSVPPYLKLEFRIAGVTRAPAYPNVFVLRFDYLHDALKESGVMSPAFDDAVYLYWGKAESPEALEPLRRTIDETFAHSPDPTMTEMEESFVAQFTKMFGDIPGIIRSVGLVVVASILLVLCNTMSSAIRERIGELAVLKAIGFSTRAILATIVGESALVGLIGGVLGCLPALLAFGLSAGAGLSMPYFPTLSVSPISVAGGMGAALCIGLAAAVLPARQIARLSAAQALRNI